jgi:Tol biopolymer transport system component
VARAEQTGVCPSFAPNGRHVVFVTTRWGKSQLAIVDLKGTLKRRITEVGNNTFPSWSR